MEYLLGLVIGFVLGFLSCGAAMDWYAKQEKK